MRRKPLASAFRQRRSAEGAQRSLDDASSRSRARRVQFRFAVMFAGLATVLLGAYAFPYAELGISERWFQEYLAAYARLAGAVLGFFGESVRVTGAFIEGRYPLRIVKTCDAMEANLLFVAAIVAFPAGAGAGKRKLAALTLGLILLIAVNVLRICSLYFIGIHAPSAFDMFHAELWPLLLIAVAVAQFVAYTTWLRQPPLAQEAAS